MLPSNTPSRRVPLLAIIIGAVVVAVVVVVVIVAAVVDDGDGATGFDLSGTDAAPDASADGATEDAGAGWEVALRVDDLDDAPAGTYYQGWVSTDAGERVTIGTFLAPDSRDVVILWSGVPLTDYPNVSVTLQQLGAGSDWSGDVVLEGTVDFDS